MATTDTADQDPVERLSGLVEELTLAVGRERQEREKDVRLSEARLEAKNRAIRRSGHAMAIALACAAAGIVVLFYQLDQAADQRKQMRQVVAAQTQASNQREIDRCETNNERAQAIRDSFGAYTDALAAIPPTVPRTADQQAAHDARVAAFKEDLTRRLAPLNIRTCTAEALGLTPPPETARASD